jgi:two-component system response regulator AtoC
MASKVSILIVDDDEAVRLSFHRILSDVCDDLQMVTDGASALGLLEKHSFDIVLLDLKMPGMDGIAVLRTIKARWPQTEVIMITGYASIETAKDAVRIGAHDYLAKPVGPDEVVRATAAALTQKRWTLARATA